MANDDLTKLNSELTGFDFMSRSLEKFKSYLYGLKPEHSSQVNSLINKAASTLKVAMNDLDLVKSALIKEHDEKDI